MHEFSKRKEIEEGNVFYVIQTTFQFPTSEIGMTWKFGKQNKRQNTILIKWINIRFCCCIALHFVVYWSAAWHYLVNCNSVYLLSLTLINPNVKIQCQLVEHEQKKEYTKYSKSGDDFKCRCWANWVWNSSKRWVKFHIQCKWIEFCQTNADWVNLIFKHWVCNDSKTMAWNGYTSLSRTNYGRSIQN